MPAGKLHIAIISTWFPTPGNTSGVFVCDQADALIDSGNKVSVFMFQYFSLMSWLRKSLQGEPLSLWIPGRTIQPLACNFVNVSPTRFSPDPLATQKKAFLQYIKKQFSHYIHKNGKPNLIHHHGTSNYCYITNYLSQQFGIPYIITEHSPYSKEKLNHFSPYETAEERLTFIRNAAARIAVSSFFKQRYEELFGVPFIVIPNLVNNEFSDAPLPSFPKPSDTFRFISIGNLSQVKRHDILIKAFAGAFKNNSRVQLHIAGTGALEENYRKLILSLGMEQQVHLEGFIDMYSLPGFIDEGHVLVISSENETFSIVAAEALFRGNPVLTTRCGGPEDFINETNGLTCAVNDISDMQQKLLEIYSKYPAFNYPAISADAKSRFSEQVIAKKLEELYSKVISSSLPA